MTMLEAGADILKAFCAVTPRAQLLTWRISYSIPFLSNPRIGMMYKVWDKMDHDQRVKILEKAQQLKNNVENL